MEWFIAAASVATVLTALGIFIVKLVDWRIDLKLDEIKEQVATILGWLRGRG